MSVIRIALALAFWIPFGITTYMAFAPPDQIDMPPTNDKAMHLLAFGYLTGAFVLAYRRWSSWRRTAALMFAYAAFIEAVQAFIPYRSFSLFDLAAGGLGIALALGGLALINQALERLKRDMGRRGSAP